jgi:hypothetical protein
MNSATSVTGRSVSRQYMVTTLPENGSRNSAPCRFHVLRESMLNINSQLECIKRCHAEANQSTAFGLRACLVPVAQFDPPCALLRELPAESCDILIEAMSTHWSS